MCGRSRNKLRGNAVSYARAAVSFSEGKSAPAATAFDINFEREKARLANRLEIARTELETTPGLFYVTLQKRLYATAPAFPTITLAKRRVWRE